MPVKTFAELFTHELQDAYDAEHQFTEAMRDMMGRAKDAPLRAMLQDHIEQTKGQIQVLEEVFNILGEQAKRVKCDGAAGLVSEAQRAMQETLGHPALRDCVIAGASARAEHYEIASYRGLITSAQTLGNNAIVALLQQNLQQEEQTALMVEESTAALVAAALQREES